MKHKVLLIAVPLVIAGIAFFSYRMYRHDMATLESFVATCERFDTRIVTGNPRETTDTLVELASRAKERISSLTKHDAEAMRLMSQIADIAQSEFNTRTAGRDSSALMRERKAAYAQFRELGKSAD